MTSGIVFVEWFPVSPCKFLADKTIVTYVTPYLSADLLITCVESHSFAIDGCNCELLSVAYIFCGFLLVLTFCFVMVGSFYHTGWFLLPQEIRDDYFLVGR